jgi:hypothetical protein
VQEKQYGLAISYYTSAEDWPGLGRAIDQALNEYIVQGPAKFATLVAEFAPSLQTLRSAADFSDYPMHGIFLHRLRFIVKYAEFHQRKKSNDLVEAAADLISMFEDDIVPTSWCGVLLLDSVEFLNYRECSLTSILENVVAKPLLRQRVVCFSLPRMLEYCFGKWRMSTREPPRGLGKITYPSSSRLSDRTAGKGLGVKRKH